MFVADRAKVEAVRQGLAELAAAEPITEDLAWLAPWVDPWFPPPDAFGRRPPFRAGWRPVAQTVDGFHVVSADRLSVILSGKTEADGKRWVHLSYARKNALPSYEDTQRARKLFLGDDQYCYVVFPPKDRYVNLHRFALHLWLCVDGPVTPEFSGVVGGERTI